MQSLNIKEWKFWKYRKHKPDTLLAFYRKKCLSSRPKKWKRSWNVYKIRGAYLQCMNDHYAKFEYKRMKTVGVTDYTNQTPPTDFRWKKCLSSTPIKMWKYSSNVYKIGGAHLKCVSNHMQSLNIKEWKLFELQITQNWHPLCISDGKNV